MKIDVTYAEVRYPTDIDLLYDGCHVLNRYIKKLCKNSKLPIPRTFETCARRSYLNVIKRKKRSKSLIHKGKSSLLAYLHRDLTTFINLIATNSTELLKILHKNETVTILLESILIRYT